VRLPAPRPRFAPGRHHRRRGPQRRQMCRDIPGTGRRLIGRLREPSPRGLEHAEHGRRHPRMPRAHVTQAHPHLRCVHHRSSSPPPARPGETLPLTSPGRGCSIYSNLNSPGCPVVFDVCSKITRGSDILSPAGCRQLGATRSRNRARRAGCRPGLRNPGRQGPGSAEIRNGGTGAFAHNATVCAKG
jgi:hypothetical protein